MAADHIDRAAELIDRRILPVAEGDPRIGDGRVVAQALDAAGLLVSEEPESEDFRRILKALSWDTTLEEAMDLLDVEASDVMPVARLVTPEHDAAVAAKALREAADAIDDLPSKRGRAVYGHERELADGQDIGLEEAADILRERADRIERGD